MINFGDFSQYNGDGQSANASAPDTALLLFQDAYGLVPGAQVGIETGSNQNTPSLAEQIQPRPWQEVTDAIQTNFNEHSVMPETIMQADNLGSETSRQQMIDRVSQLNTIARTEALSIEQRDAIGQQIASMGRLLSLSPGEIFDFRVQLRLAVAQNSSDPAQQQRYLLEAARMAANTPVSGSVARTVVNLNLDMNQEFMTRFQQAGCSLTAVRAMREFQNTNANNVPIAPRPQNPNR